MNLNRIVIKNKSKISNYIYRENKRAAKVTLKSLIDTVVMSNYFYEFKTNATEEEIKYRVRKNIKYKRDFIFRTLNMSDKIMRIRNLK